MQVIEGIESFHEIYKGELFLALGNFDGVHLGHREILRATVCAAKEKNGKSAVLIFHPHPIHVLFPTRTPSLLLNLEDRIRLIGEAGVDYIIIHPFTREFASIGPEQFSKDILIEKLHVSSVVIGFNYTFGRQGMGNAEDLAKFGHNFGFSVQVVNAVEKNGGPVASSRIRSLIAMGRVEEAGEMLGYPFVLKGEIIHGDGRGRQIGYPTANINTSCEIIHPGHGVYLTRAFITDIGGERGNSIYWSLTNVGKRPTFGKSEPSVEVHLLDMKQKNIYGLVLNVQFLQKIREEKAFIGARELAEQIQNDIRRTRRLIARRYKGLEDISNVANGFSM